MARVVRDVDSKELLLHTYEYELLGRILLYLDDHGPRIIRKAICWSIISIAHKTNNYTWVKFE